MTALAWITGLLLVAAFALAGLAKVTKQQVLMESAEHLGFTPSQYQMIGGAEAAGAVAVLLGLLVDDLSWLGLLAAVGFVVLGGGALYFHNRAGDAPKDMAPVGALTLLAILHVIAVA